MTNNETNGNGLRPVNSACHTVAAPRGPWQCRLHQMHVSCCAQRRALFLCCCQRGVSAHTTGVSELFDFVLNAGDVGASKPSIAPFLMERSRDAPTRTELVRSIRISRVVSPSLDVVQEILNPNPNLCWRQSRHIDILLSASTSATRSSTICSAA